MLLDELIGTDFGLLGRDDADISDAVRAAWKPFRARVVILPTQVLDQMFVPAGGVVIVRPDRYVAAVAIGRAGLLTATQQLLDGLARPDGLTL